VYWGFFETCKILLWKWASLSICVPLGNLRGGGSFTGDFKAWKREGSGNKCLSLWELCEGNLEGRLLYWGP